MKIGSLLRRIPLKSRLTGLAATRPRFARAARQDIDAVRNAVLEPWSNGQTEGQINRLKAIKRAMYGRAGIELLRARMIPLYQVDLHQERNRTQFAREVIK